MPLDFTPYQEEVVLRRRGLDPEKYQIEASTGSIRLRERVQPTFTPPETPYTPVVAPQPEEGSAFMAGARHFGASLLPTTGSLATAGGVSSMLTPWAVAAAPETFGLSMLVPPAAGIVSGMIAGHGINKAQEALMPESWKKQLALDVQQHPVMSEVGNITAAAPTLMANPANVIRAGKTGMKVLGNLVGEKAPIAAAEIGNLSNVGINTGLGAGGSIASDLMANQPIDVQKAIIGGVGGALFNQPTKMLGQRFGFHPYTPTENLETGARAAQVKGNTLFEEAKRIKTAADERAREDFDLAEAKGQPERPTSFYSERNAEDTNYKIPLKKISKEDKVNAPAFFDEKGELRSGITEQQAREALDIYKYGKVYEQYLNAKTEAEAIKKDVAAREAKETQEFNQKQNLRVFHNIVEAGTESGLKNRPGVDVLRQKALIKEKNYQAYKKLNYRAKVLGEADAIRDLPKFEEPGFAERAAKEQASGKPEPSFGELQSPKNLSKKLSIGKASLPPFKAGTKETAFQGEEQGLKRGENEGLIEFNERKRKLQHNPRLPFEQSLDELEKILAQAKEDYRLNPTPYKRYLVNKASAQIHYQKTYPREIRNQTEEQGLQSAADLNKTIEEKNLQPNPTLSLYNYFRTKIGPRRNIGHITDNDLMAKGMAQLKSRVATINPFKASLDTLGHEDFHIFGNDLRTSKHPYDVNLMKRFDKAVENSAEFKRINAEREAKGLPTLDPEEIGTEKVGIETARRILNPDKAEGTLRKAFQDFVSRVKIKWGKATTDEMARFLSHRFFHDPAFEEHFRTNVNPSAAGSENLNKEQEKTYGTENTTKNQSENNAPTGIEGGEISGERKPEQIQTNRESIAEGQVKSKGVEQAPEHGGPTSVQETSTPKLQGEEQGLSNFANEQEKFNLTPKPFTPSIDRHAYGHWITPSGEVIKVGTYGHERTAIAIIKKMLADGKITQAEYDKLNIPLNSTTEVEDFLHDRGYLRGVRETGKNYYVNGKDNQALTNAQRRALRDFGIEANVNIKHDINKGRVDYIFRRSEDEGKNFFQGEEQGLKGPKPKEGESLEAFGHVLPNQAWITKDGSIIEVPFGKHHQNEAEKIIPEARGDSAILFKEMYNRGYVRLRKLNDVYYANNHGQPLTAAQIRTIKDGASFAGKDYAINGKLGSRYEEESQGLKSPTEQETLTTYENPKTELEKTQSTLLDKYKQALRERKIYQDIKVEPGETTKLGNRGEYHTSKDEAHSVAEQTGTALHEAMHRLFNHAREGIKLLTPFDRELNKLIDNVYDNKLINAVDIQELGDMLRKVHPVYDHHRVSMNALAERFDNPKMGFLPGQETELKTKFIRAIDEALATYTYGNQEYKGEFRPILEKIFGRDFLDFFAPNKGGVNESEYYPKFKRDVFGADIEHHQKQIALIDKKLKSMSVSDVPFDVYDKERKKLTKVRDEYQKRIAEMKEAEPGEYYETEEQGLKRKEDILENFNYVKTAPEFQKANVFKQGVKELISSRFPIMGSDISKLETRYGKEGKMIAPALAESMSLERANEGKYLNPTLEATKDLSKDERNDLYATMLAEKKSQVSLRDSLNEDQQAAYDVIRDIIKQKQEDQIAAGQKVEALDENGKVFYRLPKIDKFYMPEIVGAKQLDILLNQKDSTAYNNLRRDFIEHQMKENNLNEHKANEIFDEVLASYGGPLKGDSTHFGAVRKAEGVGLPNSWLEGDLDTAMRRYWRRVSKDRAFYDAVEKHHDLLHILGRKRDAENRKVIPTEGIRTLGGETLDNVMDIIQGRNIKTNPRLDALARIATNLVMGPITGATDLINAPAILAKFIPSAGHIPGYLKSVMNIQNGVKEAFSTGLNRYNVTNIGDIVNPASESVERLRTIANTVAKVNSREYLERYSRGLSQALSHYLIDVHKGLAESGNQKSINLLEGLANGKDYTKLSDAELASRLAEYGQGTYDPRGLPSWAIDSQIAPLFRLSKWNIEQLNNLHKHALLPAVQYFKTGGKEGNITPMLMTMAGGAIGGYLAKQVREILNNKQTPIPTWAEMAGSSRGVKGNFGNALYNLAAAISYSGVTGIAGDVAKSILDVAHKNQPQGLNFPLIETVGDVAVKLNQAAQAIADGENPMLVVPAMMKDLSIQNIQTARIAINQLGPLISKSEKQSKEDKAARRALRTFKMVEGEPYVPQTIAGATENPYLNLESKQFKQRGIDELGTAAGEANKLVGKVYKNAKSQEDVTKGLRGLKQNTFQTMPSPETSPEEFGRFQRFSRDVYGNKKTQERTNRYMGQREANKIKASFIP